MNRRLVSLVGVVLLLITGFPVRQAGARSALAAGSSAAGLANEIITVVNNLRQEQGLNALNTHPILMQLAQTHAEYMAATGQITHLSADGRRPFQRALAAGYPVAGDLDLGGFYSQNIQSGSLMSAQEIVNIWMGDAPHQNTMLSENRSDMGAGVATAGDSVYYVLETALASPYRVVITLAASPAPGQSVYVVVPAATSTPQADGSIVHTVSMGETLWGIAAVYDTSVDALAQLNKISPFHFIHPGDQLVLRYPDTPTPLPPPTRSSSQRVYNNSQQASPTPLSAVPGRPAGLFDDPVVSRLSGWMALLAAGILGVALLLSWKKDSG